MIFSLKAGNIPDYWHSVLVPYLFFLLGPLIYYNGSRHILVGVSSFVVGSCGTIGVTDGFARVTNQIDWIRENSDNYVRTCSARIRSGIKSVVIEMKVGMIKMANRKDMKKISLPG